MSSSTPSGVQRQRQNAYDVGTNKHNKYGLNYGYSVYPDPNNPYGWQAYEADRAKKKKRLADIRAAAAASKPRMQHMYHRAANMASAGHPHSSDSSSSSSVCTSSSSCSASTCSSSPAVKELKKKEKKQRKKEKEARKKQQEEKKKRKKAKCRGSACRLKSLSTQRPAPHWCDGKKWGGKIWGLTRDPGDKNPENWGVYFHPKLSRSEVIKICRRRCPAPKKHHKTKKTKVVLTRCCHGPSCPQCQPVPGMGDAGANFDYGYGYGAADPGAGGMPVNLGPGPSVPPHAGYYSHPAGNVERWRVHTAENTTKTKSKSGSSKSSSKKGSKSGSDKSGSDKSGSDKSGSDKSSSDKSSKNKYTFYTAPPEPENKGFDNRFLYAGTEYGNDSGAGGGVRAGGNYARNGPVPVPGASFLNSISPHISDDADTNSPPAEVDQDAAGQDTQEDPSETFPKSSKGKGKMPIPCCWVESASSSTVSVHTARPSHESGRESRFDRFCSRRDDSGKLREGSWERVSPQVQRLREWQRFQDKERGRLEREAEAEAEANANAEHGYDADMKLAGPSNSSSNIDNCQVNIGRIPALASNASGNSQSDYLTMVNSSYFAHIDNHPRYLRVPTPGLVSSMPTAKPAPVSASCPAISSPYSISGDTGYETGHEADNEANKLPNEMQVYQDPGYGSMCGAASNYKNCGSGCGAYHSYGDGAVWGGLDSSSTTLLSSPASESAKERTSEKGEENGKNRDSKKGKSGKKSRSETTSSSSTGGSRASRRSKKSNKNDGGLLAKIFGW